MVNILVIIFQQSKTPALTPTPTPTFLVPFPVFIFTFTTRRKKVLPKLFTYHAIKKYSTLVRPDSD